MATSNSSEDPDPALARMTDDGAPTQASLTIQASTTGSPSADERLLVAAELAFARGDYRLTAHLTQQLIRESSNEATIEAATRLRSRLAVPGLGRLVLLLTAFVLVVVTLFAYSRS